MMLVTGGTGFIGSNLVDRMLSLGLPVRSLVRDRRKLRHLAGAGMELAVGDLSTGAGLDAALDGVDTVIHLAGVTKTLDARGYDVGNRQATVHLVAAACRNRTVRRFVHISSLAAAGPSLNATPRDETAEPNPVSHYGRSKLDGERAAQSPEIRDRAVVVRPPVVYGPRDTDVLEVFRLAAHGFSIGIGSGDSWFSLIHVQDLADGLIAVARSEAGGGSVYYLANPQPVSWRAFSETAARALGRGVRHVAIPLFVARGIGWAGECVAAMRRKPAILSRDKVDEARFRYWVCDGSRARRDFGFETRLSLEEGVAGTIHWYQHEGWLV